MSMKSFTTRTTQVNFDIDGEMFFLKAGIAAGQMFSISTLHGKMQAASGDPENNAGKVLMSELGTIFEEESFSRFEKRFWGEYGPIDLETFNELIEWMFGEALGKGPTQK
jgi:hypothetical protein